MDLADPCKYRRGISDGMGRKKWQPGGPGGLVIFVLFL